jgi:hypothetical protein
VARMNEGLVPLAGTNLLSATVRCRLRVLSESCDLYEVMSFAVRRFKTISRGLRPIGVSPTTV